MPPRLKEQIKSSLVDSQLDPQAQTKRYLQIIEMTPKDRA